MNRTIIGKSIVLWTCLIGGQPLLASVPGESAVTQGPQLFFEPNRGQAPTGVHYQGNAKGYRISAMADRIVLSVGGSDSELGTTTLDIGFQDSASAPLLTAGGALPGRSNYFVGATSTSWLTNIPHTSTLTYQALYPDIDLVLYGSHNQLEYDFVVAPNTNPMTIAMRFGGVERMEVNDSGDLVLATSSRPLVLRRPVAYQGKDGQRSAVDVAYHLREDGTVGFALGAYDPSQPLVIDPMVVRWSTYLGGSSAGGSGFPDETINNMALGDDGSIYLIGYTHAADFPQAGSMQAFGGAGDVFVTHLSADGQTLLYSTFLGGVGLDIGFDIEVDAAGNAYLTGETASPGFPTTSGAFDEGCGNDLFCDGDRDGFVVKLNPSGSALTYSTFLGGGGFDKGAGIAVDGDGNAFIVGYAESPDYPTTAGSFLPSDPDAAGASGDAFVTKLSADGATLLYSTYLGGAGEDSQAIDIAVDAGGNAHAVGVTMSIPDNTFPTTPGAFMESAPGTLDRDTFLAKLNAAGSALVFSTFLGGSDNEHANGVQLNRNGAAVVVGETESLDFPAVDALQPANAGGWDSFITQFNATGSALTFSTYLGGQSNEHANDLDITGSGRICVAGYTGSSNFPLFEAAQGNLGGGSGFDAFAAGLSGAGDRLEFSTYFGGSGKEFGNAIACRNDFSVVVAGNTDSAADFPAINAYDSQYGGGDSDAFVAHFTFAALPVPIGSMPALAAIALLLSLLGLYRIRPATR